MQSIKLRIYPLAVREAAVCGLRASGAWFSSSAAARSAPGATDYLISQIKEQSLVRTQSYIGGRWCDASDGATWEVRNPATAELLARVSHCRGRETTAAVAEAEAAFPAWAALTGKQRSKVLRRWHDLVREHEDDIATLMTLECGKPLSESRGEFQSGLASIEWFAEEAKRVQGDVLPLADSQRRFFALRQPVGVVGAVTPWNFPFSMITRKVSPALAAGCAVVLKPSELTPLTALALAALADRAGLPPGALSVVVGDAAAVGEALLRHDGVRKIAFTGSTRVGKQLAAGAAETLKRVSLELGGNAPSLVFADADVERAAAAVAASSHRNAGQTCICTNRVVVHESVHDRFVEALVRHVEKYRLGSGLDPSCNHGPLISAAAVQRVADKVADATSKGAQVVYGGSRPAFAEDDALGKGSFYAPTVLTGATPEMRCFKEEIFGPVTPVFTFRHEEEAIKMANSTEYGLAAYLYTQDLERAWWATERLEYGMVGVNEPAITSEVAPFGGVKHSGQGREQSKYGLDEYLQLKTVCMAQRHRG